MKTDESPTEVFGPHLMIDAYNCDPAVLDDPQKLYAMMQELLKILDMNALTPPYIIKAEESGQKDPGGWTGFMIIAESHISFHSFVKRKFMTMDIYSCKHFESDEALSYIKNVLKTDDVETFKQDRGLRYPSKNIA